ncbi:MAG: hypothetical protein N2044_05055 [Cyclobacteriaceae bacterium]|nr:hypothetical protein [Cyclobacteriaceae bacterium]MCX7637200.1 hypothetical protein [Cyclobacteriaceae bacterium]MDW8331434.1 hypothetical protein [Cyclobacteriaceae bacterium]
MRLFGLLIPVFLIGSCRSQQHIEEIARKHFSDYELLFNDARSFVLIKEKNSTNASGQIHWIILKCSNKKMILQGSFRPGYIKWLNNDEIEIFDAPGMIRSDENLDLYRKIISVRNANRKP